MANPRGSSPGGEQPGRPEPGPGPGAWLAWARANPALALAVLVFCVGAVAVLALNVPRGALRSSQPGQFRAASRTPGADRPLDSPAGGSGSWAPSSPGATEPAATPGPAPEPWVEQPATPPSPRGLALVYRYRRLPPGGDSSYEWIVQVRGALALLEQVGLVTWHMDPPPKNEGELISRDRARDGFPLFGDGPGGWFGVSAVVTFKDGGAETLSRKIELPDPS